MIGVMALSGVVMVLAIFVTLARVMDLRTVFGYATEIDVAFSLTLLVMFSGTYMGMMAAAFAGLTLAVCLSIGRFLFGYRRFRMVRYKRKIGVAHVYTPPSWQESIDTRIAKWIAYIAGTKRTVQQSVRTTTSPLTS